MRLSKFISRSGVCIIYVQRIPVSSMCLCQFDLWISNFVFTVFTGSHIEFRAHYLFGDTFQRLKWIIFVVDVVWRRKKKIAETQIDTNGTHLLLRCFILRFSMSRNQQFSAENWIAFVAAHESDSAEMPMGSGSVIVFWPNIYSANRCSLLSLSRVTGIQKWLSVRVTFQFPWKQLCVLRAVENSISSIVLLWLCQSTSPLISIPHIGYARLSSVEREKNTNYFQNGTCCERRAHIRAHTNWLRVGNLTHYTVHRIRFRWIPMMK